MGCMNILRLTLAPVLALAFATSAMADRLSLSEISSYMNSLKTVRAEFTQINDDGTISTGNILIRRPGRIRFDYNAPDDSLVMAGEGQVAIFDSKSNQPPERFPLGRTPLNLILGANINFAKERMIVGHTSDATTTTVIAQDPKNPEYGNIQLIYTSNPVELRQWVITDGSGFSTTVILGELNKGGSIRASFFDIDAEMEQRGF